MAARPLKYMQKNKIYNDIFCEALQYLYTVNIGSTKIVLANTISQNIKNKRWGERSFKLGGFKEVQGFQIGSAKFLLTTTSAISYFWKIPFHLQKIRPLMFFYRRAKKTEVPSIGCISTFLCTAESISIIYIPSIYIH